MAVIKRGLGGFPGAGSLAVLLMLGGCASSTAVYRNYDTLVKTYDGVTGQEAKIIAQKQLIETQQRRDYRVTAPDIKTTPEAMKYPDHWFVVFGHNWLSPISTDPMAKTYTDLKESQFLVVIDKRNGTVVFCGLWFPKRQSDLDWVFDLQGYKREDPLRLPPYEKARRLF